MERLSVLLSGIGGYGNNYVKALLEHGQEKGVYIAGAVDPHPESCAHIDEIRAKGIPIFNTMEEFYAKNTAALTIISAPIHYHCQQTCLALEHGSHVLCEKPAAATAQEVKEMIKTRDTAQKIAAIGYQWSYNPAIHQLKADINSGLFGKPKRLKTLVLWPRNTNYYKRSWAGKKRDERGNWILDSVANNATAHFLHNMLYILGPELDKSVKPLEVTAELYRANDIENFDTSAIRIITEGSTEVLFYASHAVKESVGPQFCYEFENGLVAYCDPEFPESANNMIAFLADGSTKSYGNPEHNSIEKLWIVIDAIRNHGTIPCGLEAAYAHTLCINGAQLSMPDIADFSPEQIVKEGEPALIWVKGLNEVLRQCYATGKLPSELGTPWSKSGRSIRLTDDIALS